MYNPHKIRESAIWKRVQCVPFYSIEESELEYFITWNLGAIKMSHWISIYVILFSIRAYSQRIFVSSSVKNTFSRFDDFNPILCLSKLLLQNWTLSYVSNYFITTNSKNWLIQRDMQDSINIQFNSKQSFISAVSFCIETRSCCQVLFDLCEVWNNRTFFLFHLRSKNPINKFAYQKCLFSTHTEAAHKACLPCNVVF